MKYRIKFRDNGENILYIPQIKFKWFPLWLSFNYMKTSGYAVLHEGCGSAGFKTEEAALNFIKDHKNKLCRKIVKMIPVEDI